MPAIIVHGGAGRFPWEIREEARKGCEEAARLGHGLLCSGKESLEVVEASVCALEDNPALQAGTGSKPNAVGEIEMDAIIVDGKTLDFGAVAAIRNVSNPVSVARRIMTETEHCMLAGRGATEFAHNLGFERIPDSHLISHRNNESDHGTVGAVALDRRGHIATATSTGGLSGKLPGRVGDSPLIGCGAAARDEVGGVSATGQGESLMKVMISRVVLEFIERGMVPNQAAEEAISVLERKVQGEGGVIAIGSDGQLGWAFNTKRMAFACIDSAGNLQSGI